MALRLIRIFVSLLAISTTAMAEDQIGSTASIEMQKNLRPFHGFYSAILVHDGDQPKIMEETVTVATQAMRTNINW